jgi:hypothetical protein
MVNPSLSSPAASQSARKGVEKYVPTICPLVTSAALAGRGTPESRGGNRHRVDMMFQASRRRRRQTARRIIRKCVAAPE